jgi:glucose 1-dehydrogenase
MFARMIADFGTIDILVSNAGLQQDARLEDMTLQQWNTVLGVNLTGQFLCAREAVKEFKRRGVRPDVSAPPARSSASARCTRSSPGSGTSTTPRPRAG